MVAEYIGTKSVKKGSGSTTILYVPKEWGFDIGEKVNLKVKHFDSDEEFFIKSTSLSLYGTGGAVTLEKEWGFQYGDMVEFHVCRRGA